VRQSHRPARLATRAASFRYGARHHSGIPGGIVPLYPGDFVGIRSSERIAVEPQVFDLLIYLVQNRDRVVSKDDLIASST
jgi:DNA-binding response OmpR family regulator